MRRADRLFQIVQYLRGGRLLTARDLAERLEVSERTIYRDIADLIGSGVPIEGEAGVGYLMRAGYDLPPLMFTEGEIAALVAGARLIRAWGGLDMARAAEHALSKIDAVLPEAARERAQSVQIHAIAGPEITEDLRRQIDLLDAAIIGSIGMNVAYADGEGRKTTRHIRPLGLWFWGKVWTLIAWCDLRHDFRMFRVDRISDMQSTGAYAKAPGRDLAAFYRQMEMEHGSGAYRG
ncbi:DeoR faimly transcriptional regulator [Actibacterium mucosum KCTC 23349]|uniref:DeoR faimly transcriptional regulator n=1 Tax=Actibacterium mucosum KCTC 23349 TaxID=1454373 RepID=A0A037ZH46_9RHOB|nr:YafY family protein [Actibacterium mucosum]KAJ54145.1 DeoR faimly transcriptional regulator [Actibacterium mucosum KCTC 23349]